MAARPSAIPVKADAPTVDLWSMAPQGRARMPRFGFIGELFARRAQPYQGADIETARKLVGMLWGLSAALAAAFLVLAPPDASLDSAGWPAAFLIVALSAAGARWVFDSELG